MALEMPTRPVNPESIFNTMVSGYLSKSVAGAADVTLTDTEARNKYHEYTGALTGNISVIVPAEEKEYIVYNNTTGAFTLTVKVAAQTGVTFSTTEKGHIHMFCNGTDVVQTTDHLA